MIIKYNNEEISKKGFKIGIIGNFDGFHKGHQRLLSKALEVGEAHNGIIYFITFSNLHLETKKSKALLQSTEDKLLLLEKNCDLVVNIEFDSYMKNLSPEHFIEDVLINNLKLDYAVVGESFKFGKNQEGNVRTMEKYLKCSVLPNLEIDGEIVSSSLIRHYLKNSNLEKVLSLLGRSHSIKGLVIKGKGIGSKIDFPTINLSVEEQVLIPGEGVYFTYVKIKGDGYIYKGITNIGRRPTFEEDGKVIVETHILGYNGDVYGKEVTLYFEKYVRGEIKFSSQDELKLQLEKDKENCSLEL